MWVDSCGPLYINVVQVMDLLFSTDVLMLLSDHFKHTCASSAEPQLHGSCTVDTLCFSVELNRAKNILMHYGYTIVQLSFVCVVQQFPKVNCL